MNRYLIILILIVSFGCEPSQIENENMTTELALTRLLESGKLIDLSDEHNLVILQDGHWSGLKDPYHLELNNQSIPVATMEELFINNIKTDPILRIIEINVKDQVAVVTGILRYSTTCEQQDLESKKIEFSYQITPYNIIALN